MRLRSIDVKHLSSACHIRGLGTGIVNIKADTGALVRNQARAQATQDFGELFNLRNFKGPVRTKAALRRSRPGKANWSNTEDTVRPGEQGVRHYDDKESTGVWIAPSPPKSNVYPSVCLGNNRRKVRPAYAEPRRSVDQKAWGTGMECQIVRTQIKAIMVELGVSRQVELVVRLGEL